jgi:UDP-galactose transporter B1
LFALSGATQVCAKAFTSLALAYGVSFPVVTLAKSGKMVPVMIGSLLLGGASYTLREYASVAAIIAGTTIVSTGKKSSGPASSMMGIAFVVLSLVCDGITGGVQKRLKAKGKEKGVEPKPYDMMFWTNLFMAVTAAAFSLVLSEFQSGVAFCLANPVILNKILKFAVCSAVGQSFIFYTIANFDPLVCTTVTTTRKVFSVLLSIFLNGHQMSPQGWFGITLASGGILSELQDKSGGGKHHGGDKKATEKKH